MQHIEGISCYQLRFSSLEDTISADNQVRFIDVFVSFIDLSKPERKRKNLIRLGVDPDHAYVFSRTRKDGWAIAQSPILSTTITLKRLRQKGYQSLTDVYVELNPSLCEPPST